MENNGLTQFNEDTNIQKSVTTEMMISKQAQKLQAAMVIAKKFPRNETEAYNKIMTS